MKRLFITFILAVVSTVMVVAQTFEFRMDGKTVPEGSTVEFVSTYEPLFMREDCYMGNRLVLCNLTSSELKGSQILINYSYVSGSLGDGVYPVNCMGGECRTNVWSTYTATLGLGPNGSMGVDIHVEDVKNGEMLTKLSVTIGRETHVVYIKFVCNATSGIGNAGIASASFDVYDLTGSVVAKGVSASGLRSLRAGVYILVDANTHTARKYVVR